MAFSMKSSSSPSISFFSNILLMKIPFILFSFASFSMSIPGFVWFFIFTIFSIPCSFFIWFKFIVKYLFPISIILYRFFSSSSNFWSFSIISSFEINSVMSISFSINSLSSVGMNSSCISFFDISPTITPCSPNSSNPRLIGEPGYTILWSFSSL